MKMLAALTIALALSCVPGRADSMLGTNPIKPPPLGAITATTPPAAGERWTIRTLLGVNGKFVASARYGEEEFSSGDKCQASVLADEQLKTTVASIGQAAAKRFGADAHVIVVCAMDIQ